MLYKSILVSTELLYIDQCSKKHNLHFFTTTLNTVQCCREKNASCAFYNRPRCTGLLQWVCSSAVQHGSDESCSCGIFSTFFARINHSRCQYITVPSTADAKTQFNNYHLRQPMRLCDSRRLFVARWCNNNNHHHSLA